MVTFSVAHGSGACNVQCCLQSCLVSHMAEESQDSPFSNGERAKARKFYSWRYCHYFKIVEVGDKILRTCAHVVPCVLLAKNLCRVLLS